VLEGLVESDIKRAVESLPETFRVPVLLADLEGFAYKEIAEILDVPIGTVMSRLHRGRKALQRALWDFAQARGLVPDEVTADE
jgi:RNA polymerase sigma-70 factor (ECF subfamily)